MLEDKIMIGKSDLYASRIGFGGCPLGGHGWGEADETELLSAVSEAIDNGINFFDTADVYGLGRSEELIGKGLKGQRDKAIIATKFEKWLRTALENSLRRLDVDCIDLYQVHYWDEKTNLAELLDILEKVRQEGKIRYYGITNINPLEHNIMNNLPGLASFSYEYSLAKREYEEDIKSISQKCNLSFLSWGSLGQGILSGNYDKDVRFEQEDRRSRAEYINFHGERLNKNLQIVDVIKQIAKKYPTKTVSQISLRFILDQLPRSIALVGVKKLSQLKGNKGTLGWALDEEDMKRLREVSTANTN